MVNRSRRRRYALRWMRYMERYITPERGGLANVADQIAGTKAVFRAGGLKWEKDAARNWRWSRTARRPPWQRR